MYLKSIFLFFTLTFNFSVNAQKKYLENSEEISLHTENIMTSFEKLEFDQAFSKLKKYWRIPDNEIDQLETLTIKNFNSIADRFGKTKGFEHVKDKKINNFLVRKIYVLKFERHFLRMLFTFYNNEEGWALNSFKWDDSIDEILKID